MAYLGYAMRQTRRPDSVFRVDILMPLRFAMDDAPDCMFPASLLLGTRKLSPISILLNSMLHGTPLLPDAGIGTFFSIFISILLLGLLFLWIQSCRAKFSDRCSE